jgi:hypothetical protein
LLEKECSDIDLRFDALTTSHEYSYGVGHFLNDLTATGWMNFLLIYLSGINPITSESASSYAGYFSKLFKNIQFIFA